MIGSLNGRLIEKYPTELLIECGGVGYEVKISLFTFSQLSENESIKIYTKLIYICDHIPTNEYHYLFLGRSSINLFSTFTISFKHVVKMTLIYTQMPNFTQK